MGAKPHISIEKARALHPSADTMERDTAPASPASERFQRPALPRHAPLPRPMPDRERQEMRIPGVILRITERQRCQEIRPIALHPIYIRERFFPEEIHIRRKREPRFEREK